MDDTQLEQIRQLNQQAWDLCKKDAPRALLLARQVQALLPQCAQAQPLDEFICLRTQTYCLDVLSKPEEALPVALAANQLAEGLGDNYLIGSIQSLLGRIYWHIDDFPTSMDYYLKALKLAQREHYPDLEISLTNGLGLVQYGLENFNEALGYFKLCLEKAGEEDLTGRADASNNIGYVLHQLGRDQEGLDYCLAGLALFNQLGTSVGKMETLNSLGAIHFTLGNYDEAMGFLLEGIALARQNDSPILEISYVLEISRIRQARGELALAEQELGQALATAERINSLTNIALVHQRLVDIYKEKQDFQAALAHFEAFHATYKKSFNDQSDRRIRNLEIIHQVEIARQQTDLYRELADTDFLTTLINRRRFLEIAEAAFQQAHTERAPLAIILLDVDHFKHINDQHGHKVGDAVLAAVAGAIKSSLRQGDIAGRYGGEEFIVLVSHIPAAQCANVAERIRQSVAQLTVAADGADIRATISLGLAWVEPDPALPLDTAIQRADQAMYAAKQQGRNRAVVWAGGA